MAWRRAGFNVRFVADLGYPFVVIPSRVEDNMVPVLLLDAGLCDADPDERGGALAEALHGILCADWPGRATIRDAYLRRLWRAIGPDKD